ncbi:MAG: C1 family peptidase [candidate division Zixibacteria bacterium]|nr:C1 family peptidase [candidate division Zixibacteria bacterium]
MKAQPVGAGLTAIIVMLLPALSAVASERGLSTRQISGYEEKFAAEGDHTALINAVTNNDIKGLSLDREKFIDHNKLFSLKLKSTGVTAQENSGRCWLFAGMNVFSPKVMKKLKLSDFELSQPYLTFWDKMEKANAFLEAMIELREKPLDDRIVQVHLRGPFGDGGWWQYVVDLLDKYGVVPLSAMPETKQSINTDNINGLVNRMLRRFTAELREMHQAGRGEQELRARKDEMLYDVYKMMVFNYGQPPREFEFRYETTDSLITGAKTYTPLSFYREFFAEGMPQYVGLMDDPTKEYGTLYSYQWSSNMIDRPDITFLNIPMSKLKNYCLKTLLDSQMVYFSMDPGKQHLRDSGIFKEGIYDYNSTFGLDFKLTKAQRILYGDSSPNHAMVIMGVDTSLTGAPVKWLVKNSWGTKHGDGGKWYMYDDWFDEYGYIAVVDKKLLDEEDLAALKKKPVSLPPWDPFWAAFRQLEW